MAVRFAAALLFGPLALASCAKPPGGFDSPVPAQRLDAITGAAESRNEDSIPELIRMLSSDDPLVRLAAIRSLERITGETHGYDHAAPSGERWEATRRWADWYRAREGLPQEAPGGDSGDSGPPPS
jgi:HEAT repeat protein